MATATDYLPEAVGGYLRLPRDFADNRPVDRGKSSLMVLIDQLDLLASTMDKVFDAVCRDDAAALVAHGRFLQEKFGTASTGGSARRGPGPAARRCPRHPAPPPVRPRTPAACACSRQAGRPDGRAAAAGTRTLAEALDALAELATAAGADAGPPAPRAWRSLPRWPSPHPVPRATGPRPPGVAATQDFFDAASRGRRWRDAPTAMLSSLAAQGSPHASAYAASLAEVASAACSSASRPCG